MRYDIIIIGGGPAGVSASLYAKSRGKNVAIIEKNKIGGIIGNVSTVTHYSALLENESGKTFADRLTQQAVNAGADIIFDDVKKVELIGNTKLVITENDRYEAGAVIIANGSHKRILGIPGEIELTGKGMNLNAANDVLKYLGENVYVVGGADGAIKEALYLANYVKKVTIIHFEPQLGCISEFKEKMKEHDNIEVKLNSRLTAVYGKDHVEKLEITSEIDGKKEIIEDDGCGVFVYAGLIPNTDLYDELQLQDGFIPVNEKMETIIPGVYAAGDIRVKQVRQVATAVADGAIAGINACTYIDTIK